MIFTTWKCPKCTAIGPINGGPCVECGTETNKIMIDNATENSIRNAVFHSWERSQ